ncbi:DEAD/DEAH box helicase [Sediminitomix flava]|uniref:Helicase-like protein n=1 Tax=Sediminitomix flava TaxID=379075 RepID=A0A315Z9I7_SEDFL|nr:DEAD/DEAH box helicase [Sediminitomix flava]PWJ42225.1 helicase-like protein [Sediminitomix flava]
MNVFNIHQNITENYLSYLESFIHIEDKKIKGAIEEHFSKKDFLPEPLIQFNPSFEVGKSLSEIEGIHPDLQSIFGQYKLYKHQVEALEKGLNGDSFVVTSGTGSGKSLTFLGTIFNDILQQEVKKKGVKAILVYPMNALINSQEEEIVKYEINYLKNHTSEENIDESEEFVKKPLNEQLKHYKKHSEVAFPITYKRYTGQESGEKKASILNDQPDILLTNYMMLELIMSRAKEKGLRKAIQSNLKYLVYDEMHTYRGRQGADVALLNRRIKSFRNDELICIGTSATMASGSTIQESKEKVAEVAELLFAQKYTTDKIIGEYLEKCTEGVEVDSGMLKEELTSSTLTTLFDSFESIEVLEKEAVKFIHHPLARWIEHNMALDNTDIILKRGKPERLSDIVNKLSEEVDHSIDKTNIYESVMSLLRWAEALNMAYVNLGQRKSLLPFRLHQFVSQTGNMYLTLEKRDKRAIVFEEGLTYKNKPIYQTVFSRYSGHEFICVRKDYGSSKLCQRDVNDLPEKIRKEDLKGNKSLDTKRKSLTAEDFCSGYILLEKDGEEDAIWNEDKLQSLPSNWFKKKGLDQYYEYLLPKLIYFNEEGEFSDDNAGLPMKGWFIPTYFLFDPTCDIIYDGKTTERTKLSGIGNEGRSTATTVISYSILDALDNQGVSTENQKVLSFTDNRQDASLQAGHYNDFYTLGCLRSSIYHAMKETSEPLDSDSIAPAVMKQLNLKETEYAYKPSESEFFPDPANQNALRDFLFLKIAYDLKLGWRYTAPNLEGAGLLKIQYKRLSEFCKVEEFWKGIHLFDQLSSTQRETIVYEILEFFRTSFALDHSIFANTGDLVFRLRDRLNPEKSWSLDQNEKAIEEPVYLLPKTLEKRPRGIFTSSIGYSSYLGKYLKKLFTQYEVDYEFNRASYEVFIAKLLSTLKKGHFITDKALGAKDKKDILGYRLRMDSMLWTINEEGKPTIDKIRMNLGVDSPVNYLNANKFFKSFYQQNFNKYPKRYKASEHTGQLNNEDRITREDEFRRGDISALYCSPTMELGIDIKDLNIVHMRNVPPSPANYAQRSGRAGRGGQTALVFTYATSRSPHDRHYFKNQIDMVAGVVAPPKIDLSNEELLLNHFHAMMLMDCSFAGDEGDYNSISYLVDIDKTPELPLKDSVFRKIDDFSSFNEGLISSFQNLLDDLGINSTEHKWYYDNWVNDKANQFKNSFNQSFDRWRKLFISSENLLTKARNTLDNHHIKDSSEDKKTAKREHAIALRQRSLLLGNATTNGQSEFNLFRYLASENFLPGYNFTRLPIRAYVGGDRHTDSGEYISRPRFVALNEFGPQNTIYHKGTKYKIQKVDLTDAEIQLEKIKVSDDTGYAFLNEEAKGQNNDPITSKELSGFRSTRLLQLDTVNTTSFERISSQEEERQRAGYDIQNFFSWNNEASNKTLTLERGGEPLLQLTFSSAANLIQVNQKWRKTRDEEGFPIGVKDGIWKSKKQVGEAEEGSIVPVMPYTRDTADILYIQPMEQLIEENDKQQSAILSLMYALKRGIEETFSIEENELGVWAMGDQTRPNILFFESSEGSLGVLTQLVQKPEFLTKVFENAYVKCFYDLKTKEEIDGPREDVSYDDLLSYYNQRYHQLLSRSIVKNPLERLMELKAVTQEGGLQRDIYDELINSYDKNSQMEEQLIKYLYTNDYRLPDKAQFNMEEFLVSIDFVAKVNNTPYLIFVDGSVHDNERVQQEDKEKRTLLMNSGYNVVAWHYSQPIEEFVQNHLHVFPKIKN